MKKSIKILTLVLSLALLCGMFAIAAFADDSAEIVGVKTHFYTNFDGGKSFGSETGSKTVVKDFGHDNKGSGTTQVVIDAKGNSYFSWQYPVADKAGAAGNYSFTAPNSGKAWTNPPAAMFDGYCYGDMLYYAIDFDIWFPKDVPDGSVCMYGYNYYIKGTSSTDESTGVTTYTATGNDWEDQATNRLAVKFYNTEDGGVAVAPGLGCGDQVKMLDGVWNHITVITGSRVENGKFILTNYAALNGTVFDIWDYELPTESDAYLVDGLPRWYPKTYRFEYGNDCKGNSINLDNLTIRTIEKDYNGNLATVLAGGKGTDLNAWESDIYDVANMPYATTVAKIGDKEFDHLQRAVDAAKGGDTITLTANVTDVVTLGDVITIDCGEFTCPQPKGTNGYVVGPMQDGKYIPEASQVELMIMWGGCTCGLPTCDATHPGDATGMLYTSAPLYGNLYESYETLGKSSEWSLETGSDKYTLVGWTDATTGAIYNADSTVTKEMLEAGFLMLTPMIEKTSATISYTKGGVVYYASGMSALKTALSNAPSDSTITLIGNANVTAEALNVTKNVTINLNGYALVALASSQVKGMFGLSAGKSITFLGEEEGSAIVFANVAGSAAGHLIKSGGAATVNFKGKNLKVSCGALFGTWSAHDVKINIEGGYYNSDGKGDNGYFIYGSGAGLFTLSIKDAVVKTYNPIIGSKASGSIKVENSAILGNLTKKGDYSNFAIALEKSYISGAVDALQPITVGEGCYFGNNSWVKDTNVMNGTALVAETVKMTHDNYSHPWVKDDAEASIVFTKVAENIEYKYTTIKGVNVIFKDGDTVLATVAGKNGEKVIGPVAGTAEPVADGWVMATKSYTFTIPADATADITIDIKDAEFTYTYAAGAPKLYVNYRLSDNLTINLYAPTDLPEGISNFAAYIPGTEAARTFTKGFTIGGAKYGYTSSWPGANAADSNKTWNINFTYDGQNFTYEVVVNVVDYAKKVANIYKDDAEKMEQVVALLQYVEAANKISKQTPENGLSELLAELKTTVTLRAVPEAVGNMKALATYIEGVNVFAAYNTGLKFNLKDTTKTYQVFAGTTKLATEQSGSTLTFKNQSSMLWTATDLTIKVLDAEGATVAEGTYSIAAYYTEMASSLTADELAFLQAAYILGIIGDTNK